MTQLIQIITNLTLLELSVLDVTEHFTFNVGNAEYKGKQIEDLNKAVWYIQREIERLTKEG